MRIIKNGTVVQLTYLPRLFPVNCYLVDEPEGLTLVDAALPGNVDAILKAAETLNKPITSIVLTHAHSDHIGSLDGLKARLPELKVWISARDSKLLRGDVTLEPNEEQMPIKGGVPKKVKTKPDVLLEDGDTIGSLTAISVPGHTPGSMAFFDTRSGVLLAGDAFQTRGGVSLAGMLRPSFPFPALATWNLKASLESARKLVELKPKLLAAGHGEMVPNPVGSMLNSIAAAEKKLAKRKGDA